MLGMYSWALIRV